MHLLEIIPMVIKVYVSNISPGPWPRERQLEILGDVWSDTSGYEDKISGVGRKTRRAKDLKDRASMLAAFRPGEGDELHVASLACLCFDDRDLLTVVAATDRACVTIIDRQSGLRIEPKTRPWKLAEARDAMEIARRGDVTKGAREAAAEMRLARTLERIALIRPHWHLRDHSTRELLEMAGERGHPMAPQTARHHLGSRPQRQRDHENEQAREAGRKAARAKRAAAKEEKK